MERWGRGGQREPHDQAPTYLWAGFPRGTRQTSLPWEALHRREAKSGGEVWGREQGWEWVKER